MNATIYARLLSAPAVHAPSPLPRWTMHRFVFLPRSGGRAQEIRTSRMECSLRVQRNRSGHLHSPVGDVRRRVRGHPLPGEQRIHLHRARLDFYLFLYLGIFRFRVGIICFNVFLLHTVAQFEACVDEYTVVPRQVSYNRHTSNTTAGFSLGVKCFHFRVGILWILMQFA